MTVTDKPMQHQRATGSKFVRRIFLMRILGTLLCFFPILSVLLEHQRSIWFIALLVVNVFIWPSIALFRARRAVIPLETEHQNLLVDAAAGGFWIAIMAVSPLPSVVIATILLSDRLSAGGPLLFRKAAGVMVSVFAVCWLSQGMVFDPLVSQRTMFATLPLIGIYLIALSVLTDMIATRLRHNSHELEKIAMMDPLLDIANRRLLEQRINIELYKLNQACHSSALMFIDMDNFKEVNDRFGHKVGDTLLVTVSQILQATCRETDTPARLGGDEFVILLPDTTSAEARAIAIRVMDAAAAMITLPDKEMSCTLSIGIAQATPDMVCAGDWLKAADDALYHAKREGKNRIFTQ